MLTTWLEFNFIFLIVIVVFMICAGIETSTKYDKSLKCVRFICESEK